MKISAKMLARVAKHLERIAFFMAMYEHGLILLSGPMRGGKSMTLLAVIDALRDDVPTLRIKPRRDNRQTGLRTHTGIEAEAHNITTATELEALFAEFKPEVIIVDEAQFFEPDVVNMLLALAERVVVIVGMLDMTFEPRAWPAYTAFSSRGSLLEEHFMHISLVGVCQCCDNDRATHSALTVEPPKEGTVLTGADVYLTVCESCHTPPPS